MLFFNLLDSMLTKNGDEGGICTAIPSLASASVQKKTLLPRPLTAEFGQSQERADNQPVGASHSLRLPEIPLKAPHVNLQG